MRNINSYIRIHAKVGDNQGQRSYEKPDHGMISSIGAMMTVHRGSLYLKELFAMKFKIVTILSQMRIVRLST